MKELCRETWHAEVKHKLKNLLGQYAVIREAVSTDIHQQTREETEWKTRGGEASECFSRGFLNFGVNI